MTTPAGAGNTAEWRKVLSSASQSCVNMPQPWPWQSLHSAPGHLPKWRLITCGRSSGSTLLLARELELSIFFRSYLKNCVRGYRDEEVVASDWPDLNSFSISLSLVIWSECLTLTGQLSSCCCLLESQQGDSGGYFLVMLSKVCSGALHIWQLPEDGNCIKGRFVLVGQEAVQDFLVTNWTNSNSNQVKQKNCKAKRDSSELPESSFEDKERAEL